MGLVRKFRAIIGSELAGEPSDGASGSWQHPYETLRKKWVEVPSDTLGRMKTTDLLNLSDESLLALWEKARADITTGAEFAHRGWYHALYADGIRGKKVMDVGSGFGVDSITFAQHGANFTFVDLVETNLKILERLCKMMGLKDVQFVHLQDLDSLNPLDTDYDIIMAMGSMHHAPMDILKPEYQELLQHLKVGGRWLQLAYPKSRWVRDGRPRFAHWGMVTDGAGTPWAEWLDVEKLLGMLAPAKFDVVLYQEFHNHDFNWFDLLFRGMPDRVHP
jgi:2-polyprenyl-3-methyl-5-hydroxy-6-metoxy-1,4-benzoquinol methylase